MVGSAVTSIVASVVSAVVVVVVVKSCDYGRCIPTCSSMGYVQPTAHWSINQKNEPISQWEHGIYLACAWRAFLFVRFRAYSPLARVCSVNGQKRELSCKRRLYSFGRRRQKTREILIRTVRQQDPASTTRFLFTASHPLYVQLR